MLISTLYEDRNKSVSVGHTAVYSNSQDCALGKQQMFRDVCPVLIALACGMVYVALTFSSLLLGLSLPLVATLKRRTQKEVAPDALV
jgi:hypothetical protein